MFSAHFTACVYSKETLFISVPALHDIINNDLYMLLKKYYNSQLLYYFFSFTRYKFLLLMICLIKLLISGR